jgi:Tol biopolymer transport system component
MHDTSRTDMAIYVMKLNGDQPVMCLNSAASEEYPMFSPDGRKIVFVSDRGAKTKGERNIFIADWKH